MAFQGPGCARATHGPPRNRPASDQYPTAYPLLPLATAHPLAAPLAASELFMIIYKVKVTGWRDDGWAGAFVQGRQGRAELAHQASS